MADPTPTPDHLVDALQRAVDAHIATITENQDVKVTRLNALHWLDRAAAVNMVVTVGVGAPVVADPHEEHNLGGGNKVIANGDVRPQGLRGGVNLPALPPNYNKCIQLIARRATLCAHLYKYKYSGQDGLNWRNFKIAFENWATLPGLYLCRPEFQKGVIFDRISLRKV